MANMSYCRFRNTKDDLADCIDAFEEEFHDISEDELRACKQMLKMIKNFFERQDVSIDNDAFNELIYAIDKNLYEA